jgi:DNA-directed RNA polymerase specialized sigma24 family protein
MNATHAAGLLVGCTPALSRYVRRRVDDRDTTREIVQEVSLRALEGCGPSDPDTFLAWCCGIARHVIALEWRRRRRARAELPLEDPSVGGVRDPMAGPDRVVDARVSLRRALGNSESAALLVRHYAANSTGKDLARELGLTPTALRMRMMRLRSSARARIGAS